MSGMLTALPMWVVFPTHVFAVVLQDCSLWLLLASKCSGAELSALERAVPRLLVVVLDVGEAVGHLVATTISAFVVDENNSVVPASKESNRLVHTDASVVEFWLS